MESMEPDSALNRVEPPLRAPPDPRVLDGLNRFVSFAALFSVAVGLLGFAGWTFQIPILKSVIPGRIVIKPNTTVGFVLIGLALWLLRKKDNPPFPKMKKLAAQLLAGITAVAGLLSFLEYTIGWDLGIDELLFDEIAGVATGSVRTRLMDLITALDFLSLGVALLLLDWSVQWKSRLYSPARFFAFIAAILAILGLLDFILGSRISYTHISLQSAVTFLLLAFGLLCGRTEQGFGALLASSTLGGTLTRRLLPAAIIIPIVIGVVGWRAFFAGLYSEWSGVSVMIVVSISLLAAFTVWNGYRVDRSMIERQQAHESLQRSADEIQDLYNHAPCGYHSLDEDGLIVRINDTELSWLGYAREEVIGKMKFADLLAAESGARFKESFLQFKDEGIIRDVEYDMVRRDGTTLPVLLSATAVTDSVGRYLMSRSTVYDITARKAAENEVRVLARLQSVVADLGGRALGGAILNEMLDDAANHVIRALDADYCAILQLLPNREALLLVSGAGWKPGCVGHATLAVGADSQPGLTLLSDRPVIVENLQNQQRFAKPALFQDHGVVSGVTVVLPTTTGPYGVLGAHTRRQRSFTTDEVNFLQAVANVLGSFIERGRAEAQLWRLNQAQRALSRCNQVLVRASDEAMLLQQICDVVVEEAGYRLCWVGRAEDDEVKTVRPVAQAGFEAGYLATLNTTWADAERGRGPVGTCIRTGETVLSKRISADPNMMPWRTEALKRGYAAVVAIPLIVDSKRFGALMIYSAEPDVFGTQEVALLTELAEDLAFGIASLRARSERARAEEEVRLLNAELEQRVNARTAELQAANKVKDELIVREQAATASLARAREREIEIGYRIQQTLLLDQPPDDFPGLRIAALTVPSQRIDGDFYIFIKHHDQALDVIVGDVMGKGVPAALLGAATKSHFLKALGDLMAARTDHKLPEPKEVVMLAHAGVVRHLIELESFVTLCYVRLDVNRRRFDFVDCGHTGIVHLHGGTGACEIVHGDNLPLGVREGEIYNQMSVPFEPGDLLLLYSDGITEARNPARELWGVERLEEFVQSHRGLEPAALIEALRDAVFAFSQSDRLSDDLTSVAIRGEQKQLPVARAETEIGSDVKQLCRARKFVRDFCSASGLPDGDFMCALELAVNEAASNIMKHAYHGRTDQRIQLEAELFAGHVLIRLHHVGEPFDPSRIPPPPFDGSRESGFGAYIIMQCVDDAQYCRDEFGRNCVALTKVLRTQLDAREA